MLRTPSRVSAASLEGWSIIERVTDFTHAVGRIGNRGSGLLISLPNAANTGPAVHVDQLGIILTTSFVLNSRAACTGETVTFFESPVTGTHAKWNVSPVTVQLRADASFFCSVREEMQQTKKQQESSPDADGETLTEELGYTVVACNIRTEANATIDISRVNPLPLPLILSKIPSIKVGDKHLLITHQNSQQRRYVVNQVVEVHSHHCVYAQVDPESLFASGGPIFTERGEFVGLQHQCGDSSFGIYIRDVVQHLFDSAMLGICKVPVYDADSDDADGGIEKGNANANVTNQEFNKEFSVLNRQKLIDVGAGDQIVDFYTLERERERVAKGTSMPETVTPRDHVEVWQEWYDDKQYRTLVLLLHGFPYQAKLVLMIVSELTSHGNRLAIPQLASLGGIGILLETMDTHAYNEPLVQACITSLARISLYELNREAIVRSDGIAAVISVMKEYRLNYAIQEWATYCLLNLCVDSSSGEQMPESIDGVAKYGGLDTIIANMTDHPNGRYLQRWSATLLGTVAVYSELYFTMLLERQLLPKLDDRLIHYEEDAFVLNGLMSFLRSVTKASLSMKGRGLGEAQIPVDSGTQHKIGAGASGGKKIEAHKKTSLDRGSAKIAVPRLPIDERTALVKGSDAARGELAPGDEITRPIRYLEHKNILDRVVKAMNQHLGSNDDALLFEHAVAALGNLFEADPDQIPRAVGPLALESLLERITLTFMTEIALHRVALQVMKQIGVSHPLERYTHLQNK